MTLFEQCVEAVDGQLATTELLLADPATLRRLQAERVTRHVLTTVLENTGSPRTVDEIERILAEAV